MQDRRGGQEDWGRRPWRARSSVRGIQRRVQGGWGLWRVERTREGWKSVFRVPGDSLCGSRPVLPRSARILSDCTALKRLSLGMSSQKVRAGQAVAPSRSGLSNPPSSSGRGRGGGGGEEPQPRSQVSLPRSRLRCEGEVRFCFLGLRRPAEGGTVRSPPPPRIAVPGDPAQGGRRSAGDVPASEQQHSPHLRGIPECPTRVAAGAPGVSGAVPVVPVRPPAPALRTVVPASLDPRSRLCPGLCRLSAGTTHLKSSDTQRKNWSACSLPRGRDLGALGVEPRFDLPPARGAGRLGGWRSNRRNQREASWRVTGGVQGCL